MADDAETQYEVCGRRGVILRAGVAMDSDVVGELARGARLWRRWGGRCRLQTPLKWLRQGSSGQISIVSKIRFLKRQSLNKSQL